MRPTRKIVDRGKIAVRVLLVITMTFWFAAWYKTNRDLRAEVTARERTDVVASVLTAKVNALTDQLHDAGIKPVSVFTFVISGATYVCVAKPGTSTYDCKGT